MQIVYHCLVRCYVELGTKFTSFFQKFNKQSIKFLLLDQTRGPPPQSALTHTNFFKNSKYFPGNVFLIGLFSFITNKDNT